MVLCPSGQDGCFDPLTPMCAFFVFLNQHVVFLQHYDLKCVFLGQCKGFQMVSLNSSTNQYHKTEKNTVLQIGCFGLVTRSGVFPTFAIIGLECACSCVFTYTYIPAARVFFRWVCPRTARGVGGGLRGYS